MKWAYCQVNSVNRRIADTINALKKYSFIKKFTLLTLEKYDNMRSGNYKIVENNKFLTYNKIRWEFLLHL